jgi:PAS domain S-box-containing protein
VYTDTPVERALAELRADVEELKRVFADERSASLPLVELLLRDNAKRREAEEELANAQAWMQLAQENGSVASYQYNIARNELFWSASTYSLYGLVPGRDHASLETWLGAIHSEDRERVQQVAAAAIAAGSPIDHEFRVLHPNGQIRWIVDRGRVELGADSLPRRVLGVNVDITDLKVAQAALAESEAQFRYTFEHARVGVAHVGVDGRFLQVNQHLCDIIGRSRDDLLGMSFEEITYPDDLAQDLINVRRMLSGEISHYSMEKRYVRANAEVVWADLTVSLYRRSDGTPANFISVIVDTREKKMAEERLRLTMGELSHRSKNALTVLEAVIRFGTSEAQTPQELRDALIERIQGMAASQDLLVAGEGSSASLRQLASRQLAVFLPRGSPRVRLSGLAVELEADAVHAVGLAIHELATNACKHGALSNETGTVDLSWKVREDGSLVISWSERGGPTVRQPSRLGFGNKVLERMMQISLGAEADLKFSPQGLTWVAVIPGRFVRTGVG